MLEASPDDAFLHYALAQEYAKTNEHDMAVGHYDRCLETDPGQLYAYFHKARSQEALADIEQAKQTLLAGLDAARTAGDAKAMSEIGGYLESLT
jgi:tetratricopeptide (TPR) repeat protein